jgi:hypothetical protein
VSRVTASLAGLICVLSLASCTGAPMVAMDVSDYRDTFGKTNDEQILISILRAKDNSPLHFTELATLGASLQFTSSVQATAPFGANEGSTTRAGLQGVLGAQNNPTLSLSSLETQSFTQGLLTPVAPNIMKQFFDEGIDQRLLLILFFSEVIDGPHIYLNNTKCDYSESDCYKHFYQFLAEVDKMAGKNITAHIYVELRPIGGPVPWSGSTTPGIKDLAGIDSTKYRVKTTANKTGIVSATVYSVSEPKLALCSPRVNKTTGRVQIVSVLQGVPVSSCTSTEVYVSGNNNAGSETKSKGLVVRSVYQIIEYLGPLLSGRGWRRSVTC